MIIKGMCPNCGGPITEKRLLAGLPCNRCLPVREIKRVRSLGLRKVISNLGRVKGLIDAFLLEDELGDFEEFFNKLTGKRFWSIQLAWARRMLAGESFALIAPTGVGKTTLLQVYAIFKAQRGERVLYIVPTRELMKQVVSSLKSLGEGLGVMVFDSTTFKKSEQNNTGKRVDVLTHAFLFRNKDLFQDVRYGLVIVDDFDALLKSSSLIDLILKTLGIGEKAIELARKIVALKSELFFYKYAGNEERAEEVSKKLYDVELELAAELDVSSVGQLLIASATGRAKGTRIKVLRELLGFEVGSIMDYLRNIVEVITPYGEDKLVKVLKELDGGTLVFVSKEIGVSGAKKLVSTLVKHGIKASLATSRKALKLLKSGEAKVLVGVATYYGILTRGIDEPLLIYNTVFIGVPKFEFDLRSMLENPRSFVRTLIEASRKGFMLGEEEKELVRILTKLSPGKIKVLQAGIKGYIELEGFLAEIKERIQRTIPKLMKFISAYVREHGKFVSESYVIISKRGKLVVRIPDVMTYIQASGRCSRLFKGRMTLGLSVIFYLDEDILNIFQKKLRNYVASYNPILLENADLNEIKRKQRESRSGAGEGMDVNRIKSVLIVVESPTKARTISKMFGRPGRRYLGEYVAYETVITLNDSVYVATIAPTLGHILDLQINGGLHGIRKAQAGLTPVYSTIKRCADCGYQTTDEIDRCPRCGSTRIRDSKKIVDALRKLAREADMVFLATDPDDEGEKISYDAYLLLRPYVNVFKRIEFHEVTRQGFLKALLNPRDIDLRRVDAQIVRRVDDRLIGFELSAVLKERLDKYWLGGGRVQTPVLKWVVDRYRQYIDSKGYLLIITLPERLRIKYFTKDKDVAERILRHVASEGVTLELIEEYEKEQNPRPPYTTDTLLFDGVRVLKLSPGKVMKIAQNLFELGYITYHRTDSTHVSTTGIEIAKEYLIKEGYGSDIRPRSWGGEGTHECIRPTKPLKSLDEVEDLGFMSFSNLTWYHKKLYELIFRRFIASQMTSAKLRVRKFRVMLGDVELHVEVPVEIIEEGFMKVLPERVYKYLAQGKVFRFSGNIESKVVRASEVSLYTASDVIRIMKEKRIGRPSTYAKAVENNMRHGYVVASKKRLYLIPTKLGMEVANLVSRYYPELSDVKATRELEALLDLVREGKISRKSALILLLSDVVRIRVGRELMMVSEELPSAPEAQASVGAL